MNGFEIHRTKYRGIVVKVVTKEHPFFFPLVQEALLKIYGKPTGRKLIDDIQARGSASPTLGYKVAILVPSQIRAAAAGSAPDFTPGSKAVRANEINAVWLDRRPRGAGTSTAIFWNPNVITTPDGSRPAFIGLAHELIHARRNLLGVAAKDWAAEEERTVGLNFTGDDVTENAIRAEHGLPARVSYGDIHDNFAAEFGYLGPHIAVR
jgi:hypothetical protein